MCVCVNVHVNVGTHGGRRSRILLEFQLQVIADFLIRMLGNEPVSSPRSVQAPKC